MALTPVKLTETELFESMNLIGSSFNAAFTDLKEYILQKEALNNAEITALIEAGDAALREDLDVDMEALAALKTILDGWDGTEDDALNLGQIRIQMQTAIDAQGSRVTVTENDIATIFTSLNTEAAARTALGTSLTEAIEAVSNDGATLIAAVETSLTALASRVSAIEDVLNQITNLVQKGQTKLEDTLVGVANTAKALFTVPAQA